MHRIGHFHTHHSPVGSSQLSLQIHIRKSCFHIYNRLDSSPIVRHTLAHTPHFHYRIHTMNQIHRMGQQQQERIYYLPYLGRIHLDNCIHSSLWLGLHISHMDNLRHTRIQHDTFHSHSIHHTLNDDHRKQLLHSSVCTRAVNRPLTPLDTPSNKTHDIQ